ncbi:HECT-type E3 ubiquitin transferase [Ranunculus cassubicifolius]
MSHTETSIDYHQRFDRISSKRKLDDYGPSDDDYSDLVSVVRMKKDEQQSIPINSPPINSSAKLSSTWSVIEDSPPDSAADSAINRVFESRSVSCSTSIGQSLHFFVKSFSTSKNLVIHANSNDSVESVHEQICRITGIPVFEQGLIYRGKQLQWDQTLAECSIQNDAGLELVSRMRSTQYPKTWQVINDLVSAITRLCRGEFHNPLNAKIVKSRIKEFLRMTPKDDGDMSLGHAQIFKSASAPLALVMLFLSPFDGNKDCAEDSIRLFLYPNVYLFSKTVQHLCAPIVLEFCKLLSTSSMDDPLYVSCRNSLGTMLESIGNVHASKYFEQAKASFIIQEIFPFVSELEGRLSLNLDSDSFCCTAMSLGEVRNFGAFLHPLRLAIVDQVGGEKHLPIDLEDRRPCYVLEIGTLHVIFLNLLGKIDECLRRVEDILVAGVEDIEEHQLGWSQYLSILKQLNSISTLYKGAEEKICSVMRSRRVSLNAIAKHAKRSDEHSWLLKHKDVTNFESRRHLVMLMLPEVKDDYEELHEMLIDRPNLLSESFEYIARADAEALHGGLFMEFKNEEATGPGVLREWFCLVCQAIFNPQNPLFLACPNDHRRFFPNPASHVESLHLDYFGFCGRLIALALMHKVQIGVVFDRVFFLQLAGNHVTLEDIRDADPCLYMSCKRILEMDADFLDSDGLGLTFVREIEELGSRRVVELCQGGKSISLNSKNRQEYVNLLIQHHFVTSVSEQVARFAEGFGDILTPGARDQKFFFQSLELEDFDRMLYGSNRAICIKDWKSHTEYNGYDETDNQISWFWKIVEGMSPEQQRVLLFFWTSVKYLPVEGFGGLQSVLYIYKASDAPDHLPTSHTCFYRLCLPAYPSLDVMQDCLQTITQEHVSCSFGTW